MNKHKLVDGILYTVLSQNFHFCCFRAITYIRLWNWMQFCLWYSQGVAWRDDVTDNTQLHM